MKSKPFADLDTDVTGVFVPVAAVEEGPDPDAVAGARTGLGMVFAAGFAEGAAGATAGARGGFSFSLLPPPPMLSLIVLPGGGSMAVFSEVDVPPTFGLIVGGGAGIGGSRSIGARSP